MDELMFYHSTSEGEEISALDDIVSLDFETNISAKAVEKDNSFSVTLSESYWAQAPIENGDRIYVPSTEWGGIITNVTHKTADGTITLSGTTWRGILFGIAIEPPEGQAYLTFSNIDANQAIALAIGNRYTSLIQVSSAVSGVNVSGQWRYKNAATALNDTLSSYGLRLNIIWDNTVNRMILSAEPVDELTDEVELSQDYGIDFVSKDGSSYAYNRCLALGKGELTERVVANLYYFEGAYYSTKPAGWVDDDERTLILDYPNAETEEDLLKTAKDRLSAYVPKKSIEINQVNLDVSTELGDIIGARDRLTGMVGQSRVVRKILTIRNGTVKIDLGVE